ncbi:MAG: DUF2807 domain-containing protein [Candidatus Wallbacteria bacterium]|nr:DUF2807 domain-containing protein [Candidatus Wallbacteria bacterium]
MGILKKLIGKIRNSVEGNGRIGKTGYKLDEFTAIQVGGVFNISYLKSETCEAEITTDENLLEYIRCEVRNSTLILDHTQSLNPSDGLNVKIRSRTLSLVEISGACSGLFDKLDGDIEFSVSGAAKIKCRGESPRVKAVISGAANLEARELKARDVEINLSGAGKTTVFADNSLTVSLSGAGKVVYYGNPVTVKKSVTGVGRISAGK